MRLKHSIFFILISFCLVTIPLHIRAEVDTTYLEQTSKAFSEIGKKATPAVVFIKAHYNLSDATASAEEYENPFDYFHDEFFKHFFGSPPKGYKQPEQEQVSVGSGFIVSKDGYILTNHHVIKEANGITVFLNNGQEYEAKVIGSDPRTDLAIIKIDAKDLPFLTFGDSDNLDIGAWVIAIGNPFALQASLTVGVVSAKGRQNLRITDLEDFIQTDAAINPGNSGGPLLNLRGEVIGVNTAIVSKSGGYMGIGFAIPSNMTKNVVNQIIDKGAVKRGYLGIYLQEIDKEISEAFNLEKSEGALVSEVTKDSPAEKAGLKQGDIIVEYNGRPVKNMGSFRNDISKLEPNSEITLKIIREGKPLTVKATLGAYPEEGAVSKQSAQIGLEVSELKDLPPETLNKYNYAQSDKGLIITSIKRGSLAEKAGLKPGMLVLQINQRALKSIADFQEALKENEQKKHIILLIRYQNVTRFVTIKTS
jgi:serine protease Do